MCTDSTGSISERSISSLSTGCPQVRQITSTNEPPDPPEDWLTKVVSGGSFVDGIWRTCGHPVESDLIDRSEVLPVLSVQMPVLRATDIVVTKLMALDEHYCDFSRMLPVARALREQVDWDEVRRQVADNDFAVVFLQLLERLRVLPEVEAA